MASEKVYGKKVVAVVVPSRVRGPEAPQGALALAVLEELISDVCAVAGLDAAAPVRRDIAHVVKRGRRNGG
jgi:hypothetical protein